MKRLATLVLAGAGMVLAIESLRVWVQWWQGGLEHPGALQWLLAAALPVLAALWWKHFSIFGKKNPKCLMPGEDRHDGDRRAAGRNSSIAKRDS